MIHKILGVDTKMSLLDAFLKVMIRQIVHVSVAAILDYAYYIALNIFCF